MVPSKSRDLAMRTLDALGAYATIFIFFLAIMYMLRRLAMPKPLAGIPHDPESAKRLLGDLPAYAAAANDREWAINHGMKLKTPIFQVFLKPFQKPYIFITDFYEMADISMRRFKEFDRSDQVIGVFEGIIPHQQLTLHSHDPLFKKNKELVRDLMSPKFLNNVSALHIYDAVLRLIGLWEKKLALCNVRPFEAGRDIHNATLDVIVMAAFGLDSKRTHLVKEHNFLQSRVNSSINEKSQSTKDMVFEFEHVPLDAELKALTTLSNSTFDALRSPFPKLLHFYNRHFSSTMKQAFSLADQMRQRELTASIKRRENGQAEWCALDHMLERETTMAEKEGRKPNFHSQAMASELLAYLIAGHETTSTAIRWGIKFLTDDQRAQSNLRTALRAAYPEVVSERRPPNLAEILKTSVPYLDAIIEENLRCGKALPMTMREALVDTQVLGKLIPKGTSVVLMGNGPGLTIPSTSIPFDEDKYTRSETAKEYMSKYGRFDDVGIETYYPERWLKAATNDDGTPGQLEFDPNAGPIFAFGLGPRACFGRKLAYLKMRVFFTLLFLKYKFDVIPKELAGHEETLFLTRAPTNVFVRLKKV